MTGSQPALQLTPHGRGLRATAPVRAGERLLYAPAAAQLVQELQKPQEEEESETEKAAKSGDVELLKQAIRGDEAKAKKQASYFESVLRKSKS